MTFAHNYKSHVENLLDRAVTAADGIAVPAHVKLPQALAEYYTSVGLVHDLNQAHNHLLHPEDVQTVDNMVVFMEENQGVAMWAIRSQDLELADPMVYQGQPTDTTTEWFPENATVSAWLVAMLYWQVVNGAFEFAAYAETTPEIATKVAAHFPLLARHGDGDTCFYGTASQVICISPLGPVHAVWAAGRTLADLEHIDRTLMIPWEYSRLDDDDLQ